MHERYTIAPGEPSSAMYCSSERRLSSCGPKTPTSTVPVKMRTHAATRS